MKHLSVLALLIIFTSPVLGQSLAASVDLFVYPAQNQSQQQQNNFKKAMSISLEARGYSVK